MSRLQRLEQRRIDPAIMVKASMVNEVYRHIRDSESVRYTIGAMQQIEPEYTKNTFVQGDRVKSQLEQRLDQDCDFEYQGSTTTDTHIKARSDIDLLVIFKKWFWVEPPQVPLHPYQGDPADDIRTLRDNAASAMRLAFPEASVNSAGSTAIQMSGASLTRKVDIVPASWHETNEYARTKDRAYRGIKVFDKDTGDFVANTPFLLKRRIDERDQRTHGGLRKAARLMKTLMYDSDGRVTMSSYNIVGIACNIPEEALNVQAPRELAILEACYEYCVHLDRNTGLRDSIRVADDHRTVFGGSKGATSAQLTALAKELGDLRQEVLDDNIRAVRRLVEGRVEYANMVSG